MYPLAPATATRTRFTAALTLPLGVLEFLTGAGLTVLLPFPHSRVPSEKPRLLQGKPELVVEARQGPGNTVAHGPGLPAGAATGDGHQDVDLPEGVRHLEWLRDDHPQRLPREVVFEGAAVHDDPPRPRPHPHAGDRRLPAPRAIEPIHDRHQRVSPRPALRRAGMSAFGSARATGCWA